MVVDSLGAIIAEGVGVGQRRTQKCDCFGCWKGFLEEDRNENEAKHVAARVLFSKNLRCQLSLSCNSLDSSSCKDWQLANLSLEGFACCRQSLMSLSYKVSSNHQKENSLAIL